jgi:hypothetical protein
LEFGTWGVRIPSLITKFIFGILSYNKNKKLISTILIFVPIFKILTWDFLWILVLGIWYLVFGTW